MFRETSNKALGTMTSAFRAGARYSKYFIEILHSAELFLERGFAEKCPASIHTLAKFATVKALCAQQNLISQAQN